ncbi:MFS transporter [Actinoplanes sp. NPDC051851]|uniref:MFS transporter n=1 Tax=Actinoplanes sp. NPDC051851 TaxID=3154753 RepID=UPI003431CA86
MTTLDTKPAADTRRWWILAMIGLAQLMVVLDATIVNIALPSAQADLGFSNGDRQWIVTAYSLAFGALLPLGGRVGDLIGRKRTLLIGLIGFALASAVGGAAQSFGMLVTARAVQGVFGALLAPTVLSLLTTTFSDAKERGKAFGIYGAIAGAGGAIGLLLGGALTEYLDWRWCLYVNIAIAVMATIGIATLVRDEQTSGPKFRLDIPGTLTVSAGLFSVVYGFGNAESHDWSDVAVWGWLAAAVVLLTVFFLIQARVAQPLLPLRILRDRTRGGSLLAILMIGIGMFAIFLFLTYFMQQNLGFSPIRTGVAFLPMIGCLAVTAGVTTTVILPRTGPRPIVPVGFLIAAGAMLWLTRLEPGTGYASGVLGPLMLVGFGVGLAMAPSMNAGTAGVLPADAGIASAMVNTAQQVGGSIGTAVLSTIAANAISDELAGKTPTAELATAATIHGYTTTFAWVACFMLAGSAISALLLRSGRLAAGTEAAHM